MSMEAFYQEAVRGNQAQSIGITTHIAPGTSEVCADC